MIAMGCDIGNLFTKVVVLKDDEPAGSKVARTTGNVAREIKGFMSEAAKAAGVSLSDVKRLGATGSGADLVPGASFTEEDLVCAGAAAAFYLPEVELAIEIGGQNITSILLDEDGDVKNYMRNDKCASGSGRFLEVMSNKLNLDIADLDKETALASAPVELSAQCGVFAESEVITHVNAGETRADVMAGVCAAVARIVAAQARRFGTAEAYTLTGGVARSRTVVEIIKGRVGGTHQAFPHDPALAAAMGAALLAGLD